MNKVKIFITGESGVIPMAIQRIADDFGYEIVNSQIEDKLKKFKHHQSFSVRKPEIDFLDVSLLSNELYSMFEDVDIIIHSGAYVGTDYCAANQSDAIATNVLGTNNIVNICNHHNIRLVYFSTTAIYDPEAYMRGPITEGTNIKPQTLYGITKYAGEQIVDRLCHTDKMVIRPVFGFGNYPDDLHSALTKIIYTVMQNRIKDSGTHLTVLLNKHFYKSYTRVENIAHTVLKAIKLEKWNHTFNVGENMSNSHKYEDLLDILAYKMNVDISYINWCINFEPHEDYLHNHVIDTTFLEKHSLRLDWNDDYISLEEGIDMTIKSVQENINLKPYWI